jgi:cytoplasmic iron level regulating protein YaaA (DUF328/UPF0246 family)
MRRTKPSRRVKAAAQAAGIDINNLAASETRITEAALKGSEVLRTANAATGRGNEFTFLGLRPYELQNLSYQINDVFTQLASGTSITQTFAQQGGQIFQLFQKQIVDFVASLRAIPFALTAIGAAFAGATVGVLAFVRAIDVAAERRHAIAQLTQNVDGTRYSVDKLLETAKGLEKLGVSLSEGMAAARELTNIGVDPERIKPLLELSANFANANNLKFADSFKQVMTAFTGSRQDLLKFVTQMHSLLTFDQFKQIRDAAEAGHMAEAQALALSAVSDRIREAADRNSTAIVRAFHQLQAAWNSFLESVASNTVVKNFGQQMLKFLRDSVTEATKLFGILDALVTSTSRRWVRRFAVKDCRMLIRGSARMPPAYPVNARRDCRVRGVARPGGRCGRHLARCFSAASAVGRQVGRAGEQMERRAR